MEFVTRGFPADLNVIKNSQLACMTRHAQITEQENSKP